MAEKNLMKKFTSDANIQILFLNNKFFNNFYNNK